MRSIQGRGHDGEGLTFDDISLVPGYSDILPADADVSTRLGSETREIRLSIPLISAAMDTVTEKHMAQAMAECGGLGVIHKNMSPERQAEEVRWVKKSGVKNTTTASLSPTNGLLVAAAVSGGSDLAERSRGLVDAGTDILVLDSAHGHSRNIIEATRYLRETYPNMFIIAGNVCTPDGVRALAAAGADTVKVGIGSGSICTTRVVAGVGIPQWTAVIQCEFAADQVGVSLISDGGIRNSGDVVKAFAAGAQAVMLGSYFAGAEETPGELITIGGAFYKSYRGMGSAAAMSKGSADRYGQSGTAPEKFVPEGVEAHVALKGPVPDLIHQMMGGLRSGMGYLGAPTIPDLWRTVRWVRVSPAGQREAHVHGVQHISMGSNYNR